MKPTKRIASLLLALLLALSIVSVSFAKEEGEKVGGNLIKLGTLADFEKGTLTGVEATASETSDGALRLAAGETDGEYVSQILAVEPFEYLVASWNAQVPDGTYVEIMARAYVDMKDAWTDWLSWGKWTRDIAKRQSANTDTELAGVDTDVFTVYGSDGETASLVQLKAVLHTDDPAVTPVLEQVAATYRNTLEGQAIQPTLAYSLYDGELPAAVEPNCPAISQMVREPSIGNVICSATTICTILNAHGEDLLPEQVALLCYDSEYEGFGNWAYSVATAGMFGYDAYVQYADFDVLRNELANGNPVGISVRYSASPNGSYPYLENGAANSTAGHLITITGYETVDGVEYFYSSDAAAGSDAGCLRRYRADQLDEAWSGRIAYIVHEKQDPAVNPIETIEAKLVPVEGEDGLYQLDTDAVAFNSGFRANYLKAKGGGVACFTIDGHDAVADAEKLPTVLKANRMFKYTVNPDKEGRLNLSPNRMMAAAQPGETWTFRFYIMTNDGKYVEATLDLTKPAEEAPAQTEAPAETPAPEPEATEEPAAPAAAEEGGNGGVTAAIIAVAVVLIGAAYLFFRKKKKN